ncbi:MAG: DNA polymerase III subunit delta [Alphaproteobacteria bacterium]|nr:DNA polymerase III subunit delta [Alphaproteobacteria bacterium]
MKIETRQIEAFLKAPDRRACAILLFGPDDGLVRERGARLARTVVEDLNDPFRVAELSGDRIEGDPAALADEAAALAFGGGRRVVRVRGCGNGAAPAFSAFFKNPMGDALIVVEAGDLDGRSALRKAFESAENAAAIACYADDGRGLDGVIRATLKAEGVGIADDAAAWLVQRLGADRALTRGELVKLAIYVGRGKEASLEDVRAVVGDSSEVDADDAVHAAAIGDVSGLARALDRLAAEGASPVTILRSAQRHFTRLHLCAAHMGGGGDPGAAMAKLRPPVFWKDQDNFKRALRRWDERRLTRALAALLEAELAAKSGSGRAGALAAERALMLLAGALNPRNRAAGAAS